MLAPPGKGNHKGRSFPFDRFDLDRATISLHHSLDDRQSEARTVDFAGFLHARPEKLLEHERQVGLGNPETGVRDLHVHGAVVCRNTDPDRPSRPVEFDGVLGNNTTKDSSLRFRDRYDVLLSNDCLCL